MFNERLASSFIIYLKSAIIIVMKKKSRTKSHLLILLIANTFLLGYLIFSQLNFFSADENPVNKSSSTDTGFSVNPQEIKINNKMINQNKTYFFQNTISLSGLTQPNSTVIISIHSKDFKYSTVSDNKGKWNLAINLDNVPPGTHAVAIKYINGGDYTPTLTIIKFNKISIPFYLSFLFLSIIQIFTIRSLFFKA